MSVMPAATNLRTTRSSIGTPATGTNALGAVLVNGARRVPNPAAKIIPMFLPGNVIKMLIAAFAFEYLFDILLAMTQFDLTIELCGNMFGCMLSGVDRAMLTTGAAVSDHE